jgi:hypothetical protein
VICKRRAKRSVSGALAYGLLLTVLTDSLLLAQDGASVVFVVSGGKACVGGDDVMWGDKDGRIKRWRRQDGATSDVEVPSLIPAAWGRGVVGCLIRPGVDRDLYYVESYVDRSQPSDHLANRVRTVWMSGSRHRVLLDTPAPEGGDREAEIRILPGLGVGVYDDLTIERISDGLKFKVQVPDRARLHGVWAASHGWPLESPELVICWGYGQDSIKAGECTAVRVGDTAMEQRPIAFDPRDSFFMKNYVFAEEPNRRCALKTPASIGYGWPSRATFDCVDFGRDRFYAPYPVYNGSVIWRPLRPGIICRQRSVDAHALVVQAQCFNVEGDAPRAALADAMTRSAMVGSFEHAAPSGWTVTLLGRDVDRPITGRLVPAND